MKKKPATSTAIGKVEHSITVPVPTTANEAAAIQKTAEADAKEILALVVDDDESYKFADEVLSDFARRKDAVLAMQRSGTLPLYGVIRTIEGWFKPSTKALDAAIGHLKGQIGAYRLALWQAEREAREQAATAAEAGDSAGVIESLAVASDMAVKPEGKASATFAWEVDRVIEDMLADEYWCPDRAKLDAIAAAEKGDEPPVIPGVVFKRVAKIGAKR